MSVTASGKFGSSLVFDKRGWVRNFQKPYNPQSTNQMAVRHNLGDIQKELKTLGAVLRPQIKAALGYRWNSVIINDLMANNHAKLTALQAEFTAFQAGEKTAWATADVAVGLTGTDGECLYCVASSLYDVAFRLSGDGLITQPAHDNAATVGAEWVDDTP